MQCGEECPRCSIVHGQMNVEREQSMVVDKKPVFRLQLAWVVGLALASMAFIPATASAQMFFASGTTADGPVSGVASFSLNSGAGTISVSLANVLSTADFHSSGQAVSDVAFKLSNNVTILSTSSATGTGVNIDSSGNTTSASGSTMRWTISPSSGSSFLATTLSGGMPAFLIAPSAAVGTGSYPNVNNGVQNFNPYFDGSTSITFTVSGLTSGTTVSDVQISFGTAGTEIPSGGAVPAPPSIVIALTGVGVFGFAGFALRSHRRRAILA
jgi:hypothetical protein